MTKPVCAVLGVGPGNGIALARRFAAGGYDIALLSRSPEKLEMFADQLEVEAQTFTCDARDPQSIETAFGELTEKMGPVDVLCFNAGAGNWATPEDTSFEDMDNSFRVNASGLLAASHQVVPGMLKKGGGAIMVDCMTDNRNRTVQEVRHAFSKHGGKLGTDGSVAFLFQRTGVLSYPADTDGDALLEAALDAGAEELVTNDDDSLDVLVAPEEFTAVRDAMVAAGFEPEQAEVTMRPETDVSVSGDDARSVLKLLEMLDDQDDVQNVYTNANFSADVLAEAG